MIRKVEDRDIADIQKLKEAFEAYKDRDQLLVEVQNGRTKRLVLFDRQNRKEAERAD